MSEKSDKLDTLYRVTNVNPVADAIYAAKEAGQASTELGLPGTSVEAAQAEAIARVVSSYHVRGN